MVECMHKQRGRSKLRRWGASYEGGMRSMAPSRGSGGMLSKVGGGGQLYSFVY